MAVAVACRVVTTTCRTHVKKVRAAQHECRSSVVVREVCICCKVRSVQKVIVVVMAPMSTRCSKQKKTDILVLQCPVFPKEISSVQGQVFNKSQCHRLGMFRTSSYTFSHPPLKASCFGLGSTNMTYSLLVKFDVFWVVGHSGNGCYPPPIIQSSLETPGFNKTQTTQIIEN